MNLPPSPSRQNPYLLLFRNTGPEIFQHLSAEQRQQLVQRWNAWYDRLAAAGQATEGQPLEMEGRVVKAAVGGRVVDGPFAESKEAIGGYVKLRARDMTEAVALARQHPALEYGLEIEVRPLTMECHLGVTAGHGTTPHQAAV